MKDMLTTKDVAKHLGVGRITVMRWIKSGKLKAFKVGHRTVKIPPEALEEFKKTRQYCVEYSPLPEIKETNIEDSSELIKK